VLLVLVVGALALWGGRLALSPQGRYVLATSVLGGGPPRLKPVLETALARAARDLDLPPPYPQLLCEPDSAGTHRCVAVIGLAPGVSTLQGNARFTREMTDLGATFLSGHEERDGTTTLSFAAGSRVRLHLELVPSMGSTPDTMVTTAPGLPAVEVRGRLALIVEDYGANRLLVRRMAQIPGTLTAAIRPNQENPDAWAREARQAGMEVILSLPMEPRD
jgi:hypothetical protein